MHLLIFTGKMLASIAALAISVTLALAFAALGILTLMDIWGLSL